MTEGKKEKKKSIITNKIDNYNRGRGKRGGGPKRICRTSQNIRKITVFLESLQSRVPSLTGSHNPPYLSWMPSNTVLTSGPVVGAAQILIWSYSSVSLPAFSTCDSSSPVTVERECGAAACLAGTLASPSVQGHKLPPPQELWPWSVFFWTSCSWWSESPFGWSFSVAPPVQALRGHPCLGSSLLFGTSDT